MLVIQVNRVVEKERRIGNNGGLRRRRGRGCGERRRRRRRRGRGGGGEGIADPP
jgi:hypothetical protein